MAVNAARGLGGLCMVVTAIVVVDIIVGRGPLTIGDLMVIGIYVAWTAALLVGASLMKKRRRWAVILCLTQAALVAAGAVVVLVGILLVGAVYGSAGPGIWIGITIVAIVLHISVLLVAYCARVLYHWHRLIEPPRGFEPIMPPVLPVQDCCAWHGPPARARKPKCTRGMPVPRC